MRRISCILTALLLSCPGFSQTSDRKAMECFNMGTYKVLKKDYKGAIDDFNQVIKSWNFTKVQKSKAFYWRGLVKIDMGLKEEGCIDLRRAAKSGYEMAVELSDMRFCK